MSSSSSTSSSDSETTPKRLKRKRDADDEEKDVEIASSDSESDTRSEREKQSQTNDETVEKQILSHAAQRKLKKKAQKAAEINDLSEKQEVKKETDETKPRRQNSIWVGNLAFKTTEHALRDFFTRHIPGCEITRVNMPGKTGQDVKDGNGMRGQNKGFAYVDFSTEEAKLKAIEASEQNLDGRKLLIKDGQNFEGRPGGSPAGGDSAKSKTAKKILAAQKQRPGPTLFFGNLSFQVTETSLKEMLERNWRPQEAVKKDDKEDQKEKPSIKKVRLGTFEDSGKCKGWAFVDFHNPEDATHVLINPKNHFLDGRKLVVEYASQEAVRRGGGGPRIQNKFPQKTHLKDSDKKLEDKVDEQKEDVIEKPVFKKRRVEIDTKTRHKRAKPGAALAMAKRETAAIVPSSGKKTVF